MIGVRSNLWPGAAVVAKGSHYANIYVGWGVKEASFAPPPLPTIAPNPELSVVVERNSLPSKPAQTDDVIADDGAQGVTE